MVPSGGELWHPLSQSVAFPEVALWDDGYGDDGYGLLWREQHSSHSSCHELEPEFKCLSLSLSEMGEGRPSTPRSKGDEPRREMPAAGLQSAESRIECRPHCGMFLRSLRTPLCRECSRGEVRVRGEGSEAGMDESKLAAVLLGWPQLCSQHSWLLRHPGCRQRCRVEPPHFGRVC